MRWLILFLLCILSLPFAHAGHVELTFKDRDVTLTNSIAYLTIDGIDIVDYVPSDGVLVMDLARGEHRMQVILDDPESRGNDYAGSFTIIQKDIVESDIVLSAIGSVRGFVVDEVDNMLPFANISLSCTTPPALDAPEMTNAFGAFVIKAVPTGPCRILASHNGRVGHVDIDIEQGDLADVTVRLTPPKKGMDTSTLFLILLGGLVFLLVALRIIKSVVFKNERRLWQRSERAKEEQIKEEKKIAAESHTKDYPRRSKDIMETLARDERRIVEYLLSNKNISAQAVLRHDLGIARTTLSRLLLRLEDKNIVTTAKYGKSVRVQLTDWFLGKE